MQRGRNLIHQVVPERVRPWLGKMVPRNRWMSELAYADVDWSRTPAFPLPGDGSGYIRFNLVGREPSGIVQPDAYDDLCAEITDALVGLIDDETGDRVVDKVVKTRELIEGPVPGALPDMCVSFVPGRPIERIRSDLLGTFQVAHTDPRSATHKPEGMMVAVGPGIEPDGGATLDGPVARLVDVAPTVLAQLGVGTPDPLPGRASPAFQ
jgi:predicted AlkP superfamily phosphohydrolase/phosphomutase